MAKPVRYLALDLGAESGRAVSGSIARGKLTLEEIHRFPNIPVKLMDTLHWDALRLFCEMKNSLLAFRRKYGPGLAGIGVDTWGVDFGLLAEDGSLLANPVHYRDHRTDGIMEKVFEIVPREEIYRHTGIQFMQLNTLFQLFAMKQQNSSALKNARTLLMLPSIFLYLFSGRPVNEFTESTTSQLFDPARGTWSEFLFRKLGLPMEIMAEIVPPGTELCELRKDICEESGLSGVRVIAPGTHDTASAIAAIPAEGKNWAYLSSGTWSLLGVELEKPLINDASLRHNFTNEGGIAGTFRFLKNITGLWILQECRRAWEKQGANLDYTKLTKMAQKSSPFACLINPDDPAFLNPADMPAEIVKFCKKTGQKAPVDRGSMARSILESLALKYRQTIEEMEKILGRKLETIHTVGGGIKNKLLINFTANACNKRVVAGPVEATASGNILLQAISTGTVASISEARKIVGNSFDIAVVEPEKTGEWDSAYQRFRKLSES